MEIESVIEKVSNIWNLRDQQHVEVIVDHVTCQHSLPHVLVRNGSVHCHVHGELVQGVFLARC